MADALDGVENTLEKKVGGVPVWVIGGGAGIAIAVAVWLYERRNAATTTTDTSATDDTSTDTTGDSTLDPVQQAAQDWLADNPGSAAATSDLPSPISDAQWAKNVIDQLVALGDDPTLVTNAITKYINQQGLSTQEQSVVNIALQKFGTPPEGSLPITNVPVTTTDPKAPVATDVHVTNAAATSITIAWSYASGTQQPVTQTVYRDGNAYDLLISSSARSYTFPRLSPNHTYRLGVSGTYFTSSGPRVDVTANTASK